MEKGGGGSFQKLKRHRFRPAVLEQGKYHTEADLTTCIYLVSEMFAF